MNNGPTPQEATPEEIKQKTNEYLGFRVIMKPWRGEIEVYREILVFNNVDDTERYLPEEEPHFYTKDIEKANKAFDLLYQGYAKMFLQKIIAKKKDLL